MNDLYIKHAVNMENMFFSSANANVYEVKQYTHIHSANTEPCQHLQAWTRSSYMYNQTGLQGSCSCISLKDKVVSCTKISGSRFIKGLYLHKFSNRNSPPDNSQLPLHQKGCFSLALTAVRDAGRIHGEPVFSHNTLLCIVDVVPGCHECCPTRSPLSEYSQVDDVIMFWL